MVFFFLSLSPPLPPSLPTFLQVLSKYLFIISFLPTFLHHVLSSLEHKLHRNSIPVGLVFSLPEQCLSHSGHSIKISSMNE